MLTRSCCPAPCPCPAPALAAALHPAAHSQHQRAAACRSLLLRVLVRRRRASASAYMKACSPYFCRQVRWQMLELAHTWLLRQPAQTWLLRFKGTSSCCRVSQVASSDERGRRAADWCPRPAWPLLEGPSLPLGTPTGGHWPRSSRPPEAQPAQTSLVSDASYQASSALDDHCPRVCLRLRRHPHAAIGPTL